MVTETRKISPAEHLERRIQENLAWAEQWRAENGDPGVALGAYLRDTIGLEALEVTYREYLRHEDSFLFDDYEDDEEEDNRPDAGTPA